MDKMKFLEIFDEISSCDCNFPKISSENAAYKKMTRPERLLATDIKRLSYELDKICALLGHWAEYRLTYENEQYTTLAYMVRCISNYLAYNVYYEYLTIFDPENPETKYPRKR